MRDKSGVESNLQGEEENVKKLVLLVEASGGISEDFKGEILNDVNYALARDRRFG